jgi:YbbR domain-containing protein
MNQNFKTFLLSFIFAFALWIYINLNSSYSLDFSIPLELRSNNSQALIEEIPNSLEVKVKGKGWDLISILFAGDLKYSLDITKIKKDSRISTGQFVSDRLNIPQNVSIVEINPDTISINFDKVYEKWIPVKNNLELNLKEGFSIIGDPELIPDSVLVKGAANLLNKLKWIPTEKKIINNVNSDIAGTVNIKDTLSNLIKYDEKIVSYKYKIQLSAEKNLEDIVVNILNFPVDKEILLIPPNISVSLRGGVDQLGQITIADIEANIEYSKIENDTLGFIIPEIILPDNITLLKMEPQKLQYIIKSKQE